MAATDVKSRSEMEPSLQWNLADLYAGYEAWQAALQEVRVLCDGFETYRGRLGESGTGLLAALQAEDEIGRRLERIWAYGMFHHDQNTQDPQGTEMVAKAQASAAQAGEATAFLVPELVALPEGRLEALRRETPGLEQYAHTLKEIERQRRHVLAPGEEALLAAFSPVLGNADTIAGQLSNADLRFEDARTGAGEEMPLSHGRYGQYMESRDRELRRTAYINMHRAYEEHRHTFAATLDQQLRTSVTGARVRHYGSALEAALDGRNLPQALYGRLIEAVHAALPALHRYVAWRGRKLGVDRMHFYDLYPPVLDLPEKRYAWQEAKALAREGLGPLGAHYLEGLSHVLEDRYIDVYENRGKRSGAYSMDVYDVHPYILMSFTGTRDSVFTLVHEAGHSMHSVLSRENQTFRNAQYPIFLAEIASTTNEHLLLQHLLRTSRDPDEQIDLRDDLAQKFLGTVFRQTMFAEFELKAHERVEAGGALTAEFLQETYRDLLALYYGPDLEIDEPGTFEWARIPHFYMGYYVFQYATGFIAAAALSQAILQEGGAAAERYLAFLGSGGSDDPLPILRRAGVDLMEEAALTQGLGSFAAVVEELDGR